MEDSGLAVFQSWAETDNCAHKELCSKFLSEQHFHSESKNELVNSRAALQEALWKNLKQNVNEIR